jgi:hypothetical protein
VQLVLSLLPNLSTLIYSYSPNTLPFSFINIINQHITHSPLSLHSVKLLLSSTLFTKSLETVTIHHLHPFQKWQELRCLVSRLGSQKLHHHPLVLLNHHLQPVHPKTQVTNHHQIPLLNPFLITTMRLKSNHLTKKSTKTQLTLSITL